MTLQFTSVIVVYIINRLEYDGSLVIEWSEKNFMKLNQNKCHLEILGYKYDSIWARFEDEVIFERKNQKLLGVIIDNTLSFDGYVIALHKKA